MPVEDEHGRAPSSPPDDDVATTPSDAARERGAREWKESHDARLADSTGFDDQTDGYAIASLVLGILPILGISSILAVVFGHVAVARVKRTRRRGIGMATIGLTLGYLWIIVIVGAVIYAVHLYQHDRSNAISTSVRSDLVALAVVENTHVVGGGSYTSDAATLAGQGFVASADNRIEVAVGSDGYCAVGANRSYGDEKTWYLYDSRATRGTTAADHISGSFTSAAAAKSACKVSVGDYETIAG